MRAEHWDEVIELSSEPAFVAGALANLAAVASHWTLVSTVSVYARNDVSGANETAELLEPVDLDDYGQQKVAVERASVSMLGDRLLIVRPGLIAGPGDGSDRFGYWVGRFALAGDGPVLCPVTTGRDVQVIDVRDLAAWIIWSGRDRLVGAFGAFGAFGTFGTFGTFDAVGDRRSLAETLDAAALLTGYTGTRVEADDAWLRDHGVEHWAGPRSLPLWLPEAAFALMQRDNSAFLGAHSALRSIEPTLADTVADERQRGLDRPRKSGLTREDELDLVGQFEAAPRPTGARRWGMRCFSARRCPTQSAQRSRQRHRSARKQHPL